ncbi:MAG: D-ribose ABC transporter substrate-binding protein [Candidatus Infernicultor aquiphilus]|uniref:D-ribose ABC transporter substrate-binding protein n=1 Tax=Candidatus Infernicultor aquiphilus TaxID=1805029 RepID=A0A1J5GH54_9BACT|nr:D-ribose ABC transporter substrate-binding protein [bacterium]OIP68930.1 MAG: D-ribose ABC transporter substrate-binding protein [Candidatus Atribacteria bacterium CG2_30_33_13]PIU25091.1 MAG: D-ribose ABC transporter substrate-binding protein [Candidatus Atribacteria bacterium CG08_land_8_20_14_0_20_33_29]PIW12303.1 MAG: D-ribose ABC transporter substrate-binding protein [Candidatus Atribacteria bacterium CG17_big_fil_post_rev_8_21_14_2_50_34_11]PIX34981.1 MAG: D-ribose ABC transporter subs
MKKLLLALCLVAILGISAFASSMTVGLSVSTLNNPFFVILRDGAIEQAKVLDVDLVVMDAQNDPAKQVSDIEDLIQKKVDVILLNPTDADALVPAVEEANKAGIPILTIDRSVNGGEVALHIASDNVKGGGMAAAYTVEQLGEKGIVVELEGITGASAARERGQGFDTYIAKFSGIKLAAKQTADFDRAKGMSVMENILQAQPKIDAVFAQNDEMALGAIQAIKAAKRQKEMFVVGFDAVPDALDAIKAGDMKATIAQQPWMMGVLGVMNGYLVVNGVNLGVKFIPVPLKVITQ